MFSFFHVEDLTKTQNVYPLSKQIIHTSGLIMVTYSSGVVDYVIDCLISSVVREAYETQNSTFPVTLALLI